MTEQQQPTPAQREARKTDRQRAEDIAYTLNHTITCFATDIIDPFVGYYSMKWKFSDKPLRVSACGHAHEPGHVHHHHCTLHEPAPHGPTAMIRPTVRDSIWHYLGSEAIGDIGAVPVTIAAQRYAPGFMHALGTGLNVALGPFYRWGAQRSATAWAKEQGVSLDSQEYRDRVEAIYRHETDHLPQAAMWTVNAFGLNLLTQKKLFHSTHSWGDLAKAKFTGAAVTATIVLGARAFMPETARRWDGWTSQNLFLPVTKRAGRLFGVDEAAVERMEEKEQALEKGWRERIAAQETERAAPEPKSR